MYYFEYLVFSLNLHVTNSDRCKSRWRAVKVDEMESAMDMKLLDLFLRKIEKTSQLSSYFLSNADDLY